MSIEPITITISGWFFIAIIIAFSLQFAVWILCVLDYMDKPKRNKRH